MIFRQATYYMYNGFIDFSLNNNSTYTSFNYIKKKNNQKQNPTIQTL